MPDIIARFLLSIWETLREMSPYLLLGFFAAGALSVLVRPELVERHLGGGGIRQVATAAVFGVPLPLCSCGVIPVAASLRRHGAGAGATTSFLISTPQTGVDSILATYALLGPVFAVFRPVAAFVSGLAGGALVNALGREREAASDAVPSCEAECCRPARERGGRFGRAMSYGFVTLPRDIAKPLLLGIAVAGAISALLPDDYLAGVLGGGVLPMIVMMAAGIPVYVCATASVPIAAALVAKGVSPGAALVFLMTGPATNAATVATVWKTMGKRVAALYLGSVAASALAAGLLLDAVFVSSGARAGAHAHWMLPAWGRNVAALALLGVLAAALFRRRRAGA